jgi:hypothetical protein
MIRLDVLVKRRLQKYRPVLRRKVIPIKKNIWIALNILKAERAAAAASSDLPVKILSESPELDIFENNR